MPSVAVVYASESGHTREMARLLSEALRQANCEVFLIDVAGITSDDWDRLRQVDGMLWGSPTYMGGVTAGFKAFIDASAIPWEHRHWANKLAGGFTVAIHSAGDKLSTLQQLSLLAAQHGMVWGGQEVVGAPVKPENTGLNRSGVWLGLDAPQLLDDNDRKTIALFATRFAGAVHRWATGLRD